jgi:hypothetical protein
MVSDDIGVELKHAFFDESMTLIGLLKKHIAKRVGIVTHTIENETRLVLEEAARKEILSKSLDQFKFLSIVVNACETRLDTMLGYLLREPIDNLERGKYFARVCALYDYWIDYGRQLDVAETASAKTEAVSEGYKKQAFRIYKQQDYELNRQAIHLSRFPIDHTDKLILSEATYLYNLYKQTDGKDVKVFLASTDTHFSPMAGTLVSSVVTDSVSGQLGVVCDWPNNVAKAVQGIVG